MIGDSCNSSLRGFETISLRARCSLAFMPGAHGSDAFYLQDERFNLPYPPFIPHEADFVNRGSCFDHRECLMLVVSCEPA